MNMLPIEKIKSKLLKYELLCHKYVPMNLSFLDEFKKLALYNLHKYMKVGGIYFDDNVWIT